MYESMREQPSQKNLLALTQTNSTSSMQQYQHQYRRTLDNVATNATSATMASTKVVKLSLDIHHPNYQQQNQTGSSEFGSLNTNTKKNNKNKDLSQLKSSTDKSSRDFYNQSSGNRSHLKKKQAQNHLYGKHSRNESKSKVSSLQLNMPFSSRNKIQPNNLISQSKTIYCASTRQSNDLNIQRRFEVETNDQEDTGKVQLPTKNINDTNLRKDSLNFQQQNVQAEHANNPERSQYTLAYTKSLLNLASRPYNLTSFNQPSRNMLHTHHTQNQLSNKNISAKTAAPKNVILQNSSTNNMKAHSQQKAKKNLQIKITNVTNPMAFLLKTQQQNSTTNLNDSLKQNNFITQNQNNKSTINNGFNDSQSKLKVQTLKQRRESQQSQSSHQKGATTGFSQVRRQSSMINLTNNVNENFRLSLRQPEPSDFSLKLINLKRKTHNKSHLDVTSRERLSHQRQRSHIQDLNEQEQELGNYQISNPLFEQEISPIKEQVKSNNQHNLRQINRNKSTLIFTKCPFNMPTSKQHTPMLNRSLINNQKNFRKGGKHQNHKSTNSLIVNDNSPLQIEKVNQILMTRNVAPENNLITQTKSINLCDMTKTPLDHSITMTQYSDAEFNCLLNKQLKQCLNPNEFKHLKFENENCYKFLKKSIVAQTEIAFDFFKASDYLKKLCHASLVFLSFYKDLEILLNDNSRLMYLHEEMIQVMKKYAIAQQDIDFEDLNRKQVDYERKRQRQQNNIDEIAAYYSYAKVQRMEIEKTQYEQLQQELKDLRDQCSKLSQTLKIKNRNEDFSASRIKNYKQGKGKQVGQTPLAKNGFGYPVPQTGSKGINQMNKIVEELRSQLDNRTKFIEELDSKMKTQDNAFSDFREEAKDKERRMKSIIQELTSKFKRLKDEKDQLKGMLHQSQNMDIGQFRQIVVENNNLQEKVKSLEQVQQQLLEVVNDEDKFQQIRKTFVDLSTILVSKSNQRVEMSYGQQEFFKTIINEGLRNELDKNNRVQLETKDLCLNLFQDLNEAIQFTRNQDSHKDKVDNNIYNSTLLQAKLKLHHQQFSEIFGFYPNLYNNTTTHHQNQKSAERNRLQKRSIEYVEPSPLFNDEKLSQVYIDQQSQDNYIPLTGRFTPFEDPGRNMPQYSVSSRQQRSELTEQYLQQRSNLATPLAQIRKMSDNMNEQNKIVRGSIIMDIQNQNQGIFSSNYQRKYNQPLHHCTEQNLHLNNKFNMMYNQNINEETSLLEEFDVPLINQKSLGRQQNHRNNFEDSSNYNKQDQNMNHHCDRHFDLSPISTDGFGNRNIQMTLTGQKFKMSQYANEFGRIGIIGQEDERFNLPRSMSKEGVRSISRGLTIGNPGVTKKELKRRLQLLRKENRELRVILDKQQSQLRPNQPLNQPTIMNQKSSSINNFQSSTNNIVLQNSNVSTKFQESDDYITFQQDLLLIDSQPNFSSFQQVNYEQVDYVKSLHTMANIIEELCLK